MNARDSAKQMAQVVRLLDAGRVDEAREVLLDLRRSEPRNRKVSDLLAMVEQAIAQQGGARAPRSAPPARPRRQPRILPAAADRRTRAAVRPVSTGLPVRMPPEASDDSWDLLFGIGLFLIYLVIGAVAGGFIVPIFIGNFTFGLIVGAVLGVIVWFFREIL